MKKSSIDIENYLLKNSELFDELMIKRFCKEFNSIFSNFSSLLIENVLCHKSNNNLFVDYIDSIENIALETDNYIFAIKHKKEYKNPVDNLSTNISDANYLLWLGVFIACIKNSEGYKAHSKIDVFVYTDYEFTSFEVYANYFKYLCLLAYK